MTEATRKAFHLLNRFGYGPAPGELERMAAKGDAGLSAWFEAQMHPESINDAAVDKKLTELKLLSMSIPQLHDALKPANEQKKEQRKQGKAAVPGAAGAGAGDDMEMGVDRDKLPKRALQELVASRLVRAVEGQRQFEERIYDFWFNHFNVDFTKGQVKYYLIPYERDTIRPRMFGKFRELLGAVAQSPAMLFYLDNFQSVRDGFQAKVNRKDPTKPAPVRGLNENYGRELLELHTLGVDGGYTQNDVRETARALTGWTLDEPRRATGFIFRPRLHDDGPKKILSLSLPAGGGEDEGEKVLDLLARHPSTARFIAAKLCVKFISDHPPASAVAALAAAFQKSDGDLRAVYHALFKLPEFWAAETMRAKIKTPWELIASGGRALGAKVEIVEKGRINNFLTALGEPLYRCVPPTGFKAVADPWVNAGALVTRITFGLALGAGRVPELDYDRDALRERLSAAGVQGVNPSLDKLGDWLLAGELADSTRKRLEQELDSETKLADQGMVPAAGASGGGHHQNLNLAKMVGLMLGSPEFQRS